MVADEILAAITQEGCFLKHFKVKAPAKKTKINIAYLLKDDPEDPGAEKTRSFHSNSGLWKISDIVLNIERYNFIHCFCTFLDDFYYSDNKIELIEEEPPGGILTEQEYALLAAATHRLANEYHLPIPTWVFKSKYVLAEPCYAFDTKNPAYQEYLRQTSPLEFKERNIFFGDNALARA